mmetsp:Transcript_157328/g.286451  ORF Transcript_157328/g.286451 Transcript_157328/m.286451 type:complete len:462 (+) Transcript_157328:138-1523(+)
MELRLLEYLRTSLVNNTALSEVAIQEFVSTGNRPLKLNLRTADEVAFPLLHLVVLNEATRAPALEHILAKLLQLGATPDVEDDDGDNALATLLSVAREHMMDGETLSDAVLVAQLGALVALLQSKRLPINQKEINEVCSWLRKYAAGQTDERQRVLDILATRCSDEDLAIAWCSEQLLEYLDEACDRKRSVEARRVLEFLAKGASLRQSSNGATALHMIQLNPYTSYKELLPIFRSILSKDPLCATLRDGFKRMPMHWAADYLNISSQHKLLRPNPANLLALLPSLVEMLPEDVDVGEACLKTTPGALRWDTARGLPSQKPRLRFKGGEQVLCRMSELGGSYVWEVGAVVGFWYREVGWPDEHPGAPYEVLLDVGFRVFALVDHDRIIRKCSEMQGVRITRVHKQADNASEHGHGHGHGYDCCRSETQSLSKHHCIPVRSHKQADDASQHEWTRISTWTWT